jgi:TPP-dependent pyruvate/acetoin dehydrogenase alpha subunit
LKYTKEEYLKMYELLTFGRKYEMKVPELLSTGKLPGFYHLAVGQEAIQIALFLELQEGDWASPHPRCHPFYALKCGIKEFTKEMIGKPTGLNGGVASYVHLFDPKNRICPSNGILGQTQAIGAGFALALQMDGSDAVVAIGLGDGTMEEGIVSETLNMIAAFNLKVCVILENNNISISTRKDTVSKLKSPGDRAAGFNLPVVYGDGNDILEARELIRVGLAEARKGRPNVVELKTFRLRGHFEGDPATYRSKEEVEEAMKREPVGRYAKYLLENNIATQEELDAIDAAQQKICDEAFAEAFEEPDSTPEHVINPKLVYAD